MSGSHGNLDALSSGNERLVQPPEPRACLPQSSGSKSAKSEAQSPAQWAALGSQAERLADPSLVAQVGPGIRSASLRLVASAA